VVLASANHFVLDAAGGLVLAGLGMLAAGRPAVTFSRRRLGMVQPTMAGGLWMAVDGLSGAAMQRAIHDGHGVTWVPRRARRLTTVKTRREP